MTFTNDNRSRHWFVGLSMHMLPEFGLLGRTFLYSPARFVAAIIFLQITLWTLIPSLTHYSFSIDVAENLLWGREWQMGYYKHPPLQAWLAEGMTLITGNSIWGQLLLAQLMVGLALAGIWMMARDIAGARAGVLAVLLTTFIFYFNISAREFNANTLELALWPWAIFLFWKGLQTRQLRWWMALGVIAALDFYSKYTSVILLASFAIITLVTRQGRASLKTAGPWLSCLLFVALITPHLLWLQENNFLPLQYFRGRSFSLDPLEILPNIIRFLGAQLLAHAGMFVLLALLGASLYRFSETLAEGERFYSRSLEATRFVILAAALPLVLTLTYSAVQGTSLKDMWGAPMFSLSGLLAVILLPRVLAFHLLERTLVIWLVIFTLLPVGIGLAPLVRAYSGMKPGRELLPSTQIAKKLMKIWKQNVPGVPLRIVAYNTPEINSVLARMDKPVSTFTSGSFLYNPWITPERLHKQGALFVWREYPAWEIALRKKKSWKLKPKRKIKILLPWNKPYKPYLKASGKFGVKFPGGKYEGIYRWAILPPGHFPKNLPPTNSTPASQEKNKTAP